MSKILFVNHASMGHLNTLLTIARQMKNEGHQVHFVVSGSKKSDLKGYVNRTV